MRISVTGHMDLTTASLAPVRAQIERELTTATSPSDITGVSCLARGADTVFAEAVLDLGGRLEVVLPSRDYRQRKVEPDHAPRFDRLIERAGSVRVLPYDTAGKDAYGAANEILVGECEHLFAVWDGEDGNRSGTATVVHRARSLQVPVTVIWPAGSARDGR